MWSWFLVECHLDPMTAVAEELGEDFVNVVPDLPGANSAYQILVHCCGMLEWWTRAAILGLDVDRDRDGEFTATGTLADLLDRISAARSQLVIDLEVIDLKAPPRGRLSADDAATPLGESAEGVLMHVFEELAQHHGHLEITRDVILRGRDS